MRDQEKFLEGVNQKRSKEWKELYHYFYGALCKYVTEIIKDDIISEDIVQECLVTIWSSTLNFPEIKALTGYLYRSVHNNALKYLRDQNIRCRHLQEWYHEQEEVEETFFYQAVEEELTRKLRVAISRLPSQRQTIVLLSIDGLSVQEIADQLKLSINSVKTQKKRAYACLKEHLQAEFLMLFIFHILK